MNHPTSPPSPSSTPPLPPADPGVELADWAPTLRPPALDPSDVSYVVEDTAIGRILLARKDSGALVASTFIATPQDEDVVLTRLAAKISPRVLRQPRALDEARRQLDDYLAGRSRGFTLPTELVLASDFQRLVLPALASSVGYGTRATYAELAARVERPKAARAVGAALGANPLCVVLPCHRVVASSGALTGYAGGLAAKRFLLDLEATPAPA